MSEICRELTLKEEIEGLDIDMKTKDRLLHKLKYNDSRICELECRLAKETEYRLSQTVPLKEVNTSLVTACEALSKAMLLQGKLHENAN